MGLEQIFWIEERAYFTTEPITKPIIKPVHYGETLILPLAPYDKLKHKIEENAPHLSKAFSLQEDPKRKIVIINYYSELQPVI